MKDPFRSVLTADDEFTVLDDELLKSHAVHRDTMPPMSTRSHTIHSMVRERRHVRPGEVVAGKYRVERRIADVGLATLLQVRHLVLDETATLKYLRPEARALPEAIGDFLTGARRLSQVRNEHVARVVDVGMLEFGTPYMVTEQPDGPDLAQVIRVRGPLPLAEAISYIVQACGGIAAVNELGVVHGGLTTENIFLCKGADGSLIVRLAGFTTSGAELSDHGGAGAGMLTAASVPSALRYLSPEHARDPGNIDTRADVWALGAILHELLAGTPVFEDRTVPGLLAKIVADEPMPISSLRDNVPPGIERAIWKCLQKQRDLRFTSARAFALALQEADTEAEAIEREAFAPAFQASTPAPPRSVPPPLPASFTPTAKSVPTTPIESATPIETAEVAKQPVAATLPPPPLPPPSLLSSPASTIAPSATPALAANSIRPGSATSSRNAGRNTTNIILGVVAAALFVLIGERLLSRNEPAPAPAPTQAAAPAPAAVLLPPPTVTSLPAAVVAATASPQAVTSVVVPPPAAMPIASAASAAPAPPAPIAAAPTAAAALPAVRATPRPKRSERPAPSEPAANIDSPSTKPADATPKAESTAKPEPSAAPAKPSGNGSRAGLFDEKWWQ